MLEGKIALVTGAARGIGKAVTELFAQNGAVVYANDLRGELLNETVKEIAGKFHAEIIPLIFDVTDTKEQKNAFQRIWKERGRLDILVNNAGLALSALIEMNSKTDVERNFAVNAVAVIEMTQLAIKLMKRNEIINNSRGSIINISSIAGINGNRGQIAYSGSKAATIGITKSSAKELSEYLIRVNAIAPGVIQTPMLEEALTEKVVDDYVNNSIGMHRVGTAQDVANAVLFFASDVSNYITAQVIGVDGGFIL
ncbi:MAG: SDR family oxidoreductase [Spirochaetes bacterium]|nr:SDR family oxidoreductase [Spirochaetota bacterium]